MPRDYDANLFAAEQQRKAQIRGFRDVGGLPWWAWHIAARCHHGDWRAEVRRLPRGLGLRIQRAAELGRTRAAQRSIAALGLVLAWCSLRHPRYCGTPTNVAGLSGESLAQLTRHDGAPYSLSWLQHANHEGAGPGNPEEGTAGALEILEQCGALTRWVPPAQAVEPYMRGEVYAFHLFRVPWSAFEYGAVPRPEPPS